MTFTFIADERIQFSGAAHTSSINTEREGKERWAEVDLFILPATDTEPRTYVLQSSGISDVEGEEDRHVMIASPSAVSLIKTAMTRRGLRPAVEMALEKGAKTDAALAEALAGYRAARTYS